jgi:hypothetical protein
LKTYDPDPPKAHVMPVIEDHPDYAVCYCEMCGANLSTAHNEKDGSVNVAALIDLVGAMCRWSLHKPVYMRVLACKIVFPQYTIRDVGEVVGLEKSRVQSIMGEVAKMYPALNPILGFQSIRSRGQTNRRKKEGRKQNEQCE